jgi:hypothetical protein
MMNLASIVIVFSLDLARKFSRAHPNCSKKSLHISTTAHHILHVHQNYGQITFTDGYKYHMKSNIQSPHFELNHIWFIKSKYTAG